MNTLHRFSILLCFALLCIHALLMPIQADEAAMLLYIHDHGFWTPLIDYTHNTNTHPLLGLIMSVFLVAGVKSVFLFRLPSLLAATAVLLAVDKLNNNESPAFRILLPFFIVSIPLFFDYLVLERGYALGLAFILWGILSYSRSTWIAGLLFALSIFTVPVLALDVMAVCAAMAICMEWKQATKTLIISAVLSIMFYLLMFKDAVTNVLAMQGQTEVLPVFSNYLTALSAFGWIIGLPLLCIATFFAIRNIKEKNFLDTAFLCSLCTLPIGFPRAHLLIAVFMVLILFREMNKKMIIPLFAISALFLLILPWNTIASNPDQKPVTGYSIARQLTDCLSVQRKGEFVTPHDFYERIQGTDTPLKAGCPDFLMIDDPVLNIPENLKMFPDILNSYGVAMYKHIDLEGILEQRRLNVK